MPVAGTAFARTLADVRAIYEREASKIEQEHESALAKALKTYGVLLDRTIQDVQREGNLDELIRLREEKARFEREKAPPGSSSVGDMAALRRMAVAYEEHKQKAGIAKHKATVSLADKYIAMLDKMSKELVRSNRIDEALAVKKEIESAEFNQAVASAALKQLEPAQPEKRPVVRRPIAPKPPPMLSKLTGPVLRYSFNDGGNKVKDMSGNGHDAKLHNVSYVDGVEGKGIRFSSSSTYLLCESSRFKMGGWRELTVSIWVQMRGYSTYGRMMSRTKIGMPNGVFGMTVGGKAAKGGFGVGLEGGDRLGVTIPKLRTRDEWYHLCGVFDGKSVTYYVDGEMAASEKASSKTRNKRLREEEPDSALVLGKCGCRFSWGDTHLVGATDELAIYDRALSSLEVKSLYKQYK